jgi:uncharacterized protein (DUF1697 family)
LNVYVALLRGINVGGNNLIRMPALKACFETQGYSDVSTYIQSGNVLFTASRWNADRHTARMEAALSSTFAYQSRVVVRSLGQMKAIVDGRPKGFGARPAEYRYDVIFLRPPLSVDEAIGSFPAKAGIDRVLPGDGVVYCSRLISKASQSGLSRVAASPAYRNMTIRNWNTTTKLLELMERVRCAGTGKDRP